MAATTCVAGLEDAMRSAGLEIYIPAAAEWCDKMGARDLEEITEDDVFQEFASELKLKPLEKKRLWKAIAPTAAIPVSSPTTADTTAQGYSAAALPKFSMPPMSHSVFVKNTFLDLDDGKRGPTIRRSCTVPVAGAAQDLEEEAELEDVEEEAEAEAEADETQSVGQEAEAAGLYKTITCDGYEPMNNWDWMRDTEQQLPSVAENTASQDSCSSYADAGLGGQFGMQSQTSDMVGMVMIPMDSMPSYAMPVPSGLCFPGYVPVPIDRFQRYPGAMDGHFLMAGAADEPSVEAEPLPVTSITENRRDAVLQRAFSVASKIYRIRWTVDARKLKSTDREHVSPSFDLSCAVPVSFKMILRPRMVASDRGGAAFKRSRGRGTVQIRCMAESDAHELPVVTFRIGVGSSGQGGRQLKLRGPVRHDFSEKNMCGLPQGQDEWDFSRAVDEDTQTFVICLEVLSGSADT
eukprot:TRINITY_DN1707_c0_g1_i1.p1 TRINITY_DN1707_c0_g1~~TRINITY_DN1707_c0_g1_i1.p1  ORF type:complete len:463 (+),score=102.56 TRINITY_DN1707_c0_g1_i1:135-1523(+)